MLNAKRAIVQKSIPMKMLADYLGIAEKTLFNKLTGSTEFTYGEARKLHELLPEYSLEYLMSEDTTLPAL